MLTLENFNIKSIHIKLFTRFLIYRSNFKYKKKLLVVKLMPPLPIDWPGN